jgi:hypothetical protein
MGLTAELGSSYGISFLTSFSTSQFLTYILKVGLCNLHAICVFLPINA